ncbi:MAG: hypothetical protein JO166_23775, partial [Deltaproteobacteria bacterium]|nr:hypothetical protein [Deltaproteobacteria bacterium]
KELRRVLRTVKGVLLDCFCGENKLATKKFVSADVMNAIEGALVADQKQAAKKK